MDPSLPLQPQAVMMKKRRIRPRGIELGTEKNKIENLICVSV